MTPSPSAISLSPETDSKALIQEDSPFSGYDFMNSLEHDDYSYDKDDGYEEDKSFDLAMFHDVLDEMSVRSNKQKK